MSHLNDCLLPLLLLPSIFTIQHENEQTIDMIIIDIVRMYQIIPNLIEVNNGIYFKLKMFNLISWWQRLNEDWYFDIYLLLNHCNVIYHNITASLNPGFCFFIEIKQSKYFILRKRITIWILWFYYHYCPKG